MRFNTATIAVSKTTNLAGGEAYQESPKLEFVSILLTSFVRDQFYKSADDGLQRVKELIEAIADRKFVAKAAIYARTKYGMRSISHVVAGELAKAVKGERWTRRFFENVIHRPDDMLEIVAYYKANYGKAMPNALKDGFAAKLAKLDEYQLAKYKAERKAVNIYDLVNLCHPKATAALNKLMKSELAPAETWEVKLTQSGQRAETDEQKAELKKEAWTELIESRKLGYFALLRNLRNILEQAPEVLDQALLMLTDERLIKKSLVLPFRFTTALEKMEELCDTQLIIKALNQAVDIALSNVPHLEGKTLVALDCSGSMEGKPAQIGALFAAVLLKSNDADLILFSDNARYKTLNTQDSTLTMANSIKFAMGGTNFHAIFETANRPYARIIILSDMQGWIGHTAPTKTFQAYCQQHACHPKVYSFDLQGYGTLQFPEKDVYCLAGFSDKVFDTMQLLETDREALLHEIEAVEL